MQSRVFYTFAAGYGCTSYGKTVAYNSCTPSSTTSSVPGATTTTGTPATGGTALVNTGTAIVAVVTLACLLIFLSLFVRLFRRKTR